MYVNLLGIEVYFREGQVLKKESGSMKKRVKTLVVGVKLATASREVLTWTLVKLARPGDHVIALHVVASSSDVSGVSSKEHKKTDNQLATAFDAVIGVYQGFCNLKQVDLEVKISHGPVRKILLEETKLREASELILGTSKKNALVSPISLAKYCAQRLPSNSSVLVVDHGKVAFQKNGSFPVSGTNGTGIGVLQGLKWKSSSSGRKVLQRSLSITESLLDSTSSSSDSLIQDSVPDMKSDHAVSPMSVLKHHNDKSSETYALRSCFTDRPFVAFFKPVDGKGKHDPESENYDSGGLSSADSFQSLSDISGQITPGEDERGSFVFPTQVEHKQVTSEPEFKAESSPGWPLLHRAISMVNIPSSQTQARKMSVVEWALQLPDRHEQVKGARAEVTHESSMKGGEIGNSMEINLRESSSMALGQIEGRQKKNSLTDRLKCLLESKTCKQFTYDVLESATLKFSEGNLVGKGGCSRVYRGVLPDGQSVAVKLLNFSPEAEDELLSEVEIITSLQHKNIIVLIGYCIYGEERLLVYNFVSRGNLEENLHVEKDKPVIPWNERLKVAVGVAEALDYLHDGCNRPVIHRDVKSSNILLFDDFEPQLSDFGLAKWASTTTSHIICNDVVGTFGYLAPEYFLYGKVNEKTDVFSFGVVLLELITGKKPIDTKIPNCQESLVTWARPLLENGSMKELVDPNLEDAYDECEMQRMIHATALCLRQAPRLRPRMTQILKLLRGEGDDLTHWTRPQLNTSIPKHTDTDNDHADATNDEEDGGGNYEISDLRNHLTLAMLGVDDDVESFDNADQNVHVLNSNKCLEAYLGGRYSRSSSFE